ncbi:hypothetical protein [Paraburkholderia caffeinilytica]|uniref:hypothetical protein n=1 Tax=Paraburkholderia caffeinilytica TaxID=1761016 RepID=UPI003DA1C334
MNEVGLSTINLIENPNGTGRVKRYRDANMAVRWAAAGLREALPEKLWRERALDTRGSLEASALEIEH